MVLQQKRRAPITSKTFTTLNTLQSVKNNFVREKTHASLKKMNSDSVQKLYKSHLSAHV